MLEFRPHHFLCTLGFEGKGYSEDFVENFQTIAERLRNSSQGDSTEIRVVDSTDSICSPCPNRQKTVCTSEQNVRRIDQAHTAILGIKSGDQLSWGEAKALIAKKMTITAFDKACAPCEWKAMGVCQAALERLHEEHRS